MKFEYTSIGDNYFPLIDIELIFPNKSVTTKAYVDSGATYSIFKSEIAEILSIDFKKGKKIYPVGVGGHICAYIHNIKMKVRDLEFNSDLLFSDELIIRFNIIGRLGFFNKFKVCFDDKDKVLELIVK